eukprot:238012_1
MCTFTVVLFVGITLSSPLSMSSSKAYNIFTTDEFSPSSIQYLVFSVIFCRWRRIRHLSDVVFVVFDIAHHNSHIIFPMRIKLHSFISYACYYDGSCAGLCHSHSLHLGIIVLILSVSHHPHVYHITIRILS